MAFHPAFLFSQKITFTVSPSGDDSWSGSADEPLKSLEGARNKIRQLRNQLNYEDTIWVIVKAGNYQLTSTFELFPEDSGTPTAPVIYEAEQDEKAIFSGGIQIEGFTKMENGLWKAHIPEVTYWNWTFDQLYVNGRRAVRAKSPNKGFYFITGTKAESAVVLVN